MSTASPQLVIVALYTVEASEVTQSQVMSLRLHSNAIYKYSYPGGARNDGLTVSMWLWTICMCLHSSRICV